MRYKILFPLLLCALLLLWREKASSHWFHPQKLQVNIPFTPAWETSFQNPALIHTILKQPFTFFDFGSQCYVFLSEDQNYVLKLFRYNRSQFPWIQKVKALFRKKLPLLQKLDKTFSAYRMGYEELSDCTELIYVQLNLQRDSPFPPLKLTDSSGRKWEIPSHQVRFALQKKARPFEKTLRRALAQEDPKEARELLHSFVALLEKRVFSQVKNSDHNLFPNFGFIGNKAVEIDCGNYRKAPELQFLEAKIEEMDRFIRQLKLWLAQQGFVPLAEELSDYFALRKQSLFDEYEKDREEARKIAPF